MWSVSEGGPLLGALFKHKFYGTVITIQYVLKPVALHISVYIRAVVFVMCKNPALLCLTSSIALSV